VVTVPALLALATLTQTWPVGQPPSDVQGCRHCGRLEFGGETHVNVLVALEAQLLVAEQFALQRFMVFGVVLWAEHDCPSGHRAVDAAVGAMPSSWHPAKQVWLAVAQIDPSAQSVSTRQPAVQVLLVVSQW